MDDRQFESALETARLEAEHGDHAVAVALYRDLARRARIAQDPDRYVAVLFETIQWCTAAGDAQESMIAYSTLADFAQANDYPIFPGDLDAARAEVWVANGEIDRALDAYVAAATAYRSGERNDLAAAAIARCARVAHEHKSPAEAILLHRLALDAADGIPEDELQPHIQLTHLDLLAKSYVDNGQFENAISTYTRLQDVLLAQERWADHATINLEIGAIAEAIGRHADALGHWECARATFIDIGMLERAEDVAQALRQIDKTTPTRRGPDRSR